MTGPLAPLFAQVRDSFEKLRLAGRTSDILKVWCDDGIDALSSIERHVQDMEKALEWYAEWRNYRYPAGDDRLDEHAENYCAVIQNDSWLGGQPGSRARAALPAREKEEE